jgi:hypothetical protein
MIPLLVSIGSWCSALLVVCSPFIKIALLWVGWQTGVGWAAWSTARFYSNNCAAPGLWGFTSSLFTMGSPICIGAWFSHAAFVVAYVTAFITAVLVVMLWLWKHITQDKSVQLLKQEIYSLNAKLRKETRHSKGQTTANNPPNEVNL